MRFLADENMHPLIVRRLREAGHRVEWIAESGAGQSDQRLLERPDIGELVLITFDRDFGDLIFNRGYPPPRSILYSRLSRARPDVIADRILRLVETGVPDHHLVTITAKTERLKPFPLGASNG